MLHLPQPLEPASRSRSRLQRFTGRRFAERRFAALAAISLAGFAVSCASPGPPRPPSLHLPATVTDLTADRVGDRVLLHWMTPQRTTDGLPVPSPLTAEVCREMGTPPPPPAPSTVQTNIPTCTAVLRIPVKPGFSEAAETLPAALTADPVAELRYRVRILNPENRAAPESKAAIAASGAAPPAVVGLHATASREGAVVQWSAIRSPAVIELERRTVVSAQEKGASAKPAKQNMQLSGSEEPVEVKLRSADPGASTTTPETPDAGGTLDSTARRGDGYIYRAQRLRTVTLNGRTLELRSELSSPVTLRMIDTFPPSPPTGLASVPSGSSGKAAIDLSWQLGADIDLAGYNIYRRSGKGAFARLNPTPLPGPAYTDATAMPPTVYTYRVTAVDATGNESAPSTEVTETAQAPNP